MSSSESNNESLNSSKKKYLKPVGIKRERPKRSSSQNVDYSLKHRKIIESEDAADKKKQKLKDQLTMTTDISMESQYVKKPLFQTDSTGEIIGMYDEDEVIDCKAVGNEMEGQTGPSNVLALPLSASDSSSPAPHVNTVRYDVVNGATGLPLGQFPTERIKKERLWNYKKIDFSSASTLQSNTNLNQSQKASNSVTLVASPITTVEPIKKKRGRKKKVRNVANQTLETWDSNSSSSSNSSSPFSHDITPNSKVELEERLYKPQLKTHGSDNLTHSSSLRHILGSNENIDLTSTDKIITSQTSHHIISKPLSSKNKLFSAVTTTSPDILEEEHVDKSKNEKEEEAEEEEEESKIENDDFCSTCGQTGSFLCCDTCPKSFHFLCLDPPMDPNNLPEGDWSCPNCIYKLKFPNQTHYKQGERQFINDRFQQGKGKLFSKLLFKLQSYNPIQFALPNSIKDTFEGVKTSSHNQYTDETFKTPLSEKQLFNNTYGQSITRLDSYYPEIHYSTNDDDPDKFLICYKCHTTKFGTWDHPEKSSLLIKCDYCRTPWHLDCIPNIPRASLKNLGYKWKCPLHANSMKERRLARKQPSIRPLQSCGFKNNGDIEIVLDEITVDKHKNTKNSGDIDPIPIINESSIKIDFVDKIFEYKRIQELNELKLQEHLIDKLIDNSQSQNVQDIASLVYFNYCSNKKQNEKLWNFRELCHLVNDEVIKNEKEVTLSNEIMHKNGSNDIVLTSQEVNELLLIKKLIESKPKEEIVTFFGLK